MGSTGRGGIFSKLRTACGTDTSRFFMISTSTLSISPSPCPRTVIGPDNPITKNKNQQPSATGNLYPETFHFFHIVLLLAIILNFCHSQSYRFYLAYVSL